MGGNFNSKAQKYIPSAEQSSVWELDQGRETEKWGWDYSARSQLSFFPVSTGESLEGGVCVRLGFYKKEKKNVG